MTFLAELWRFLRSRKEVWLPPLIVVLIFFGALIVALQSSAAAPFIYTLF